MEKEQGANGCMNKTAIGTGSDAGMTQGCSLDVLARALIRARPDLPAHLRPLASLLAEQLKNYEGNPAAMRTAIVRTIERIEGERG